MAINILLILAISDKLEWVFSRARRMILWEQSRLGVDTIKWIKCLKH